MTEIKLPPGPPPAKNPIDQLRLMMQFSSDLMGTLARWIDVYGDLYCVQVGQHRQYVTTNPDVIHEVLVKQASKFYKDADYTDEKTGLARFLGNGLLTSNGEFWKRQRRLAAPAFHLRRIEAYAQTMVDYTINLLNQWRDGAQLDIHAEMTRLTMLIVAKTLFNADVVSEVERVGRAMDAIQRFGSQQMKLLPPWFPTPLELQVRRARHDLDEIIYRLIGERRASGEDKGDLLSMLLLAEDEDGNRMTDRQARDEAVTLFLAGHETTANALSWTWLLLAQNPAAEAKLHAELDTVLAGRPPTLADLEHLPYTEMVIKESLRIYPPAWGFSRVAIEDVDLGLCIVPAGSVVGILSYFTHHDPRWWDEPEQFRPERFSPEHEATIPRYAYLPFGGGPRICIGNAFAMMEARLILAAIASRYRPSLHQGYTVKMLPRITLNPKGGLPVTLRQRHPTVETPQPVVS